MAFDISKASNFEQASAGVPMEVLAPSGEPLRDGDGNVVTITLRGRLSREAQAAQRENANRRLDLAKRGKDTTAETIEYEGTLLLAACTAAWSFTELDGQPFPFTPENARKFWADERFRGIREQANIFVANEQNFTKR